MLITRRSKLYYTACGIIIPVGAQVRFQPVHRTSTYRIDDTRCCIIEYSLRGLDSSVVQQLATGWKIRRSNPGRDEIFRTCPDRSWAQHSLLYNGYRVSFPGVMRPGQCVDHPSPSSSEVKERVELYLYSPLGTLWPVLG